MRLRLLATALAATGCLAIPAAAQADSIAYIKSGDVWLANADGTGQQQVTRGGGYRSPSQADDGTIVASQGDEIVRLTQRGTELSRFDPPPTTNSAGQTIDGVPVDVAVSPDGTKVALTYTHFTCPPGASCGARSVTMYSHADRVTPPSTFGRLFLRKPSWVSNARILAFGGYLSQVNIDAPDGGVEDQQHWFDDEDLYSPSTDLGDGELSRQGNRHALIRGYGADMHVMIFAVSGERPERSAAGAAGARLPVRPGGDPRGPELVAGRHEARRRAQRGHRGADGARRRARRLPRRELGHRRDPRRLAARLGPASIAPTPKCEGREATIVGQGATTGTAGYDVIVGSGAVDTINAGAGNDTICALGANDTIVGGAGNDRAYGGAGNDRFNEGSAASGADRLDGEAGTDTVSYPRAGAVRVSLNAVADDGATGEGDHVAATVENVIGGNGADTIAGSASANDLRGGGGNDTIRGSGSSDTLVGGAGADALHGDGGMDALNLVDGVSANDSGSGGTETDTASSDAGDALVNVP